MIRITHELCITLIQLTHELFSPQIQLTHELLKRKITSFKKRELFRPERRAKPYSIVKIKPKTCLAGE
jgi:hypothetical protein